MFTTLDAFALGVVLEPFNQNTGGGILWDGSVTTPNGFIGGEGGAGQWGYAQIITPTSSYTDAKDTPHSDPQNGQTGLDTQFLYAGFSAAADGTHAKTGDTPSFSLNNLHSANIAGTFQTYMLYQPPDAGKGTGTTWVPLRELDWNWHGVAVFNIPNQAWELRTADGITVTKNALTQTLPSWTKVITAGAF